MNVDVSPASPTPDVLKSPSVLSRQAQPTSTAAHVSPSPAQHSGRALRVRPSDSGAQARATRPNGSLGARIVSQDEIDRAKYKLGPEATRSRRDEVIRDREAQLRVVVEGHDLAVREKFHLERYISILEGWNPVEAVHENSPVFMEYKDAQYDLLRLVPTSTLHTPLSSSPSSGPRAGPSKPRSSLPSRTTRRQAHEQSEVLAKFTAINLDTRGNNSTTQSKGKAKAVEIIQPVMPSSKSKGRRKSSAPETEMPPPPVPIVPKKSSRRTTIHDVEILAKSNDEEEVQETAIKGKKRPRLSLPILRDSKKTRVETIAVATISPSPDSPAVSIPPREPSPTPIPGLPPAPLPSLAHLPFAPPPIRPRDRRVGTSRIVYTDPTQRPIPSPRYGGDILPILESYIHIEDTGPQPDLKVLEFRAAREGYVRNRVNFLQQQGRLLRLLDDEDATPVPKINSHQKKPQTGPPPRKNDHQDFLMMHMVQVRNAMLNEAKLKPSLCRKVARMIQLYWEHIEGKDERERQAEERERKRRGRDVVKALRKRWSLAVKIVRARILSAQKLEQDRLGKEHLQNMLQRSTGLLEAQRDEFVGRDDEEDDDSVSDATDDVSAAEHSSEDLDQDRVEVENDERDNTEALYEDGATIDVSHQETVEDENSLQEDDDGESSVDLRTLITGDFGIDDDNDANAIDDVDVNPIDIDIDADAALSVMATSEVVPETAASETQLEATQESAVIPLSTLNTFSISNDLLLEKIPTTSILRLAEIEASNDLPLSPIRDSDQGALTTPTRPSRRLRRQSQIVNIATQTDDPYASDPEFIAAVSDVDNQDIEFDAEMDDAEASEGDDDEDEGLIADADVPIEVLLKRYGYPMAAATLSDSSTTSGVVNRNGNDEITEKIEVERPASPATAISPPSIKIDKTLTDEAFEERSSSSALFFEGKRQRRARTVWTPEDNPPHPTSQPRKPKIREIEAESVTESASDEEEYDEEDEESEEEDAEADAAITNDKLGMANPDDQISSRLRPPFLLRGTLRPYQHDGLEWLASLYTNNMNGILADEMGLGKTIQTIALLGHLACDKGVWGQHLIIVPTSVILNWEMEFKKFLPGMKVLTYYGNQKERKEKRVGWHTENAWQVCITSYQIVLADQHIFRRKNWVYMILDEAHNIKNFRSQRWQTLLGFKAQRRLLLTGTPLQNNLMELWSLLYFLMPNGITADATAVVGFANHKEFTEWFSNPMDKAVESGETLDDEMLETVSKLHTLLRPFILRRLKAEVETQLPGKFEHVVYCRLSKRQRFLYDEFMSRASTRDALTSGGYLGVVNTLMQLRKVCNHPDLFEVRSVRTSFAMDRSVASDFEPTEVLIRKRLLEAEDEKLSLNAMNLVITAHEDQSGWAAAMRSKLDASDQLPYAIEPLETKPTITKALKGRRTAATQLQSKADSRTLTGWTVHRERLLHQASVARWRAMRDMNRRRCQIGPIFGSTTLAMLSELPRHLLPETATLRRIDMFGEYAPPATPLIHSFVERVRQMTPVIDRFAVVPPNAVARDVSSYALPGLIPSDHPVMLDPTFDSLHGPTVRLQIAFPDASLLQYDCGKLQKLHEMLHDLKAEGHRVLIFTQMTRVLDILEMFLSYNGHRYLRLDGSTKIEDRQVITERFNSDSRIFCFIASSRSGGVGINLTGADTVFFYDSDWNPSMDRQCMDRAHRIGQTREVHIYRFVSLHTVEENMLKKANQKRLLDRVVIQDGDFTTEFFGRMDWRDMLDDDMKAVVAAPAEGDNSEQDRIEDVDYEGTPEAVDAEATAPRLGQERELALALAQVEDEEDVEAARVAQGEGEMDFAEFGGTGTSATVSDGPNRDTSISATASRKDTVARDNKAATPVPEAAEDEDDDYEQDDDEPGAVDEYMLRLVEWDWEWFSSY